MKKIRLSLLVAVGITLALSPGAGVAKTAAGPFARHPSADPVPKCWKVYNPKLYDGLYHITIPATDALTAKDVQAMIFALQAFGVASHSVTAVGGDTILLEAQFVNLTQAKNLGYPSQDKLEGLVDFVLKDELPYLAKGVTISCLEEHPLQAH